MCEGKSNIFNLVYFKNILNITSKYIGLFSLIGDCHLIIDIGYTNFERPRRLEIEKANFVVTLKENMKYRVFV